MLLPILAADTGWVAGLVIAVVLFGVLVLGLSVKIVRQSEAIIVFPSLLL